MSLTAESALRAPCPPAMRTGARVIAVLRAQRTEACLPVVEHLIAGGVRLIELTMTTPGAHALLRIVRERCGSDADVGLGTITNMRQAQVALDQGADFLVTPTVNASVVALAAERGAAVFPGGLTPTELYAGWQAGATAVKIFPATLVGPDYVGQLRGPFPDLEVVPSGGVGIENAADWITAGAAAVSLGGPLLRDALDGGDLNALRMRARRVTELTTAAAEHRQTHRSASRP